MRSPNLQAADSTSIEGRIKSYASQLGFDLVGITTAEPSVFAEEYRDWIANGYAGEMGYLARNIERRLDPRQLLPNARSIIVVGMNYYTRDQISNPHPRPPLNLTPRSPSRHGKEEALMGRQGDRETGRVEGDAEPLPIDDSLPSTPYSLPPRREAAVFARYARGDDYHDVMTKRLRLLLEYLKAEAGPDADGRVYVDTGPILEREVALRAGLGWFGKNTMLINTRRGSYFFLGEIVTNVLLKPDEPAVGGCGTCTRCLDACPTDAFAAPFVLDSRRCISYLTIELKGAIPEEFIPAIGASGNRIYGCDICQEVCPFSRKSVPTTEPAFQPRELTVNSSVTDLMYLTEEEFREKFKGSPVKRAKRRGLLRNAAAALSSRIDPEAIAALRHALNDPEQLVRDSAEWSLAQIERRQSTTQDSGQA